MIRTTPTIACSLSVVLAILAAPSRAAERSCPSLLVEADAAVRAQWPDLDDRIRRVFDGRRDIDVCATVELRYVGGAIAVEVLLPDGRSTSRVTRREDVMAGLEALLLVPEKVPPATEAPPASASATTSFEPTLIEVHGDVRRSAPERQPPSGLPAGSASRFRIELSLGGSLQVGDGQTSASIGASSLLDVAGWLAGFTGRLDQFRGPATADGDSLKALAVGMLAGRRFGSRSVSLDLVGGPALALRGSWAIAMVNTMSSGMAAPMRVISSKDDLVPRLLLAGRLTLGARSNVRTFVGLDGEVGEAGPVPPATDRGLPRWMVGISVGATLGTL